MCGFNVLDIFKCSEELFFFFKIITSQRFLSLNKVLFKKKKIQLSRLIREFENGFRRTLVFSLRQTPVICGCGLVTCRTESLKTECPITAAHDVTLVYFNGWRRLLGSFRSNKSTKHDDNHGGNARAHLTKQIQNGADFLENEATAKRRKSVTDQHANSAGFRRGIPKYVKVSQPTEGKWLRLLARRTARNGR